MVVHLQPCRRRGGLWWRREVASGGEWRWGLVEKKSGGREKRMESVGIKRINSRRCERQLLVNSITVVQNAGH